MPIQGVIFDKDGTLFDFRRTWDVWAGSMVEFLAAGDADLAMRLAAAIDYDLANRAFRPESRVIAGTNMEAAELLAAHLPHWDLFELEQKLAIEAAHAPLAPAVPLEPLLNDLRKRDIKLGVMTNDSERGAQTHLDAVGVLALFDFVAGYDSGFGAKPDPDPLLAFAKKFELDPADVVMVGDSTHDLLAGRRAGMRTLGVLTGIAGTQELMDLADEVAPDIGHLPDWITRQTPQGT